MIWEPQGTPSSPGVTAHNGTRVEVMRPERQVGTGPGWQETSHIAAMSALGPHLLPPGLLWRVKGSPNHKSFALALGEKEISLRSPRKANGQKGHSVPAVQSHYPNHMDLGSCSWGRGGKFLPDHHGGQSGPPTLGIPLATMLTRSGPNHNITWAGEFPCL